MVKGTIHRVKLLVYNGLTLIMNGWAIICNFSIENFMQSHISPITPINHHGFIILKYYIYFKNPLMFKKKVLFLQTIKPILNLKQ